MIPSRHGKFEEGVAPVSLNLRCQHACSCSPCLAGVSTRIDDEDPPSACGKLPCTGSTDGAAADYDDIMKGSHGPSMKLSETLPRTAA